MLPFRIRNLLIVAVLASAAGAHAQEQKGGLGVVDVSIVFKRYPKVAEVQEQVDQLFGPRREELVKKRNELMEMGENIKKLRSQLSGQSEVLFDQVQVFQKKEFLYEKMRQQIDADFVQRMRRDMKDVLDDIRAAINAVAEEKGLKLIMRSADADNLQALGDMEGEREAGDEKKDKSAVEIDERVKKMLNPSSTVEVVGRFKQNPVLYGAAAIDMTDEVLTRLRNSTAKVLKK